MTIVVHTAEGLHGLSPETLKLEHHTSPTWLDTRPQPGSASNGEGGCDRGNIEVGVGENVHGGFTSEGACHDTASKADKEFAEEIDEEEDEKADDEEEAEVVKEEEDEDSAGGEDCAERDGAGSWEAAAGGTDGEAEEDVEYYVEGEGMAQDGECARKWSAGTPTMQKSSMT
ncbi:hypothetical protein HPB52_005068 [Rhipicephalus sanguineus]|uniref:Uncharacterized protein n=1 Tax=Rhipicephalus sanguineus TaxID=34632 RepID=A0A9D4PES9_RHISA|nr:hypothetical protein HPB52_005068 [Rhipicephalus sanguineus]